MTHEQIQIQRCDRGHGFFEVRDRCPRCDGSLQPVKVGAHGRLVVATTVHVNPAGVPFRLGLVEVDHGARTLCVVSSEAGAGEGVALWINEGVYHARPL